MVCGNHFFILQFYYLSRGARSATRFLFDN